MDSNPEWADAVDSNQATTLRIAITNAAANAVRYGNVDQDWANTCLQRLGAQPVTQTSEYRINTAITGRFGKTIKAKSRGEALEKFAQHVARIVEAGQITDGHCDGVYNVEFLGAGPDFFSGPQDPQALDPAAPVPDLDGLKTGIWKMLKEGVADHDWGMGYARSFLAAHGLPPLPERVARNVEVPVSGKATLTVYAYVTDDDAELQRLVSSHLSTAKAVLVKPEEMGDAVAEPLESDTGMGLTLVNDSEDEDLF